ncbi:Dolichyl-diphosphooligosaccharide-protein glycosyltransferase subunit [Vararia minispora EC-137]|uniref:Dolichyl-diphosphooligosaccharide-protein glycosyltransferase subunit n=1 Tax=Vararia minispora EC-137 TaxID=1314806 RepID=A0ACB8Q8Z2_9AGAM|nr:Dolichyl-diphosphooligosaccharide-protein glycosyltransferase subunit [Vararia minispora EC-137]
MRFGCAILFTALAYAAQALAKSSTGDSVLVVLQPSLKKEDYSLFFGNLEKEGYELTFRAPTETEPQLVQDGVPTFDHVIFFAPDTKSFAPDITPQSVVSLLSQGVNILIALSPKQTPLYTLASEFGLILPPPNTPLISHFPKRNEPSDIIPIAVPPSPLFSNKKANLVWFSGVPHALSNSPLLVPVLRAPAESFATDTESDAGADAILEATERGGEGLWAGSQLGVVTGFQTKRNTRVMWAGGVELFSDAFAKKEVAAGVKSGNEDLARDIAAWTFQETMVLRLDSTTHHLINETAPREHYTINEQITFEAHVSQFDPERGIWVPKTDLHDLQLDFTMLDPHIRTALPHVAAEPGTYSVTFRAPDRHGVFKFVIDHKRTGYTFLESSTTVPVVPPRHDGYPRFLSAAWPYYAGAISTSVGFVLFSALWLAGDDRTMMRKGKGAPKTE